MLPSPGRKDAGTEPAFSLAATQGARVRRPSTFAVSVLAGAAIGYTFGDWLFPELRHALGSNELDDVVLGIGGAFLGGLIHEVVMHRR